MSSVEIETEKKKISKMIIDAWEAEVKENRKEREQLPIKERNFSIK